MIKWFVVWYNFNTIKRYNANKHYLSHKDHKLIALKGDTRNSAILMLNKK